jgi:nicotinamide mononucleotide transporter
MSLVELLGTLSGLWCVWLTAKNKISCWPIGVINIVFFFVLFYQVHLYSDMLLQAYFLVTSLYGWYKWNNPKTLEYETNNNELKITTLTKNQRISNVLGVIICTVLLYSLASNIHNILPDLFPQPAAAPFRDALCAVMSIFAQLIMTHRKLECWVLWILVDIISCVYYFEVGVVLVGIEYVIFTFIATKGLLDWRKEYNNYGR